MATLWVFGDSLSDFYYPHEWESHHWKHEYIKWKGYNTKVYSEFIAEKLNMKLVNCSRGGCDNTFIIGEFCKVCDQIQSDDIVIFGWTATSRFRLPNKTGQWIYFNREPKNEDGMFVHGPLRFDTLSKNTISEMLINRFHSNFIVELCSWIKLINFSLKDIKVIHWSWYRYNSVCSIHHINTPYETIIQETNGDVADGHWSENGQYEFSKYLLNLINTNQSII